MEDRLRLVLSLANEWVKFAETKNGALLVANSAAFFGVLSLAQPFTAKGGLVEISISLCLVLLCVSSVLCLISFIPSVWQRCRFGSEKPADDDSLIFFRDIARYDPCAYLDALHARSGKTSPHSFDKFEEDLARQSIEVSQTAIRKYRYFDFAVRFTIIAVVSMVVAVLAYV